MLDAAVVGAAALVTALATGLGALPFLLVHRVPLRWVALAGAAAGGFMLAASAALVVEGVGSGAAAAAVGALAGAGFLALARGAVRHSPHAHLGRASGAAGAKMLLIVLVMTVHSVTEGVGVGVSFGGGEDLGAFITAAIAIHNVPEGLAISLVLVPRGASVLAAAGWSVFSSLPQPLLAVPAFVFVEAFAPLLPLGLGFAAGAMTWMVVTELLPDARAGAPGPAVAAWVAGSFAVMTAIQALLLL